MRGLQRRIGSKAVTKRRLGEGYLLGTSALFGFVLLGTAIVDGDRIGAWIVVGLLPVTALVAVVYWFHRLDLDGEQVWTITEFAALGTGLVTLLVFVLHLATRFLTVSSELTVALATAAALATFGGALVGIVAQVHRSKQRLLLRNTVLYRLLRHNLRNDMTVVLAHLDSVKPHLDGPEREKVAAAEQKIDGLVELTDKVRRINLAREEPGSTSRVELCEIVEERIDELEQTYPDIDVDANLPDAAHVYASDHIGLVIDNVVESAVSRGTGSFELQIEIRRREDEIILRLEDGSRMIPESDLSAIAAGTESDLEHAGGIELWLAYWLAERSGGELAVETTETTARVEVALDRAVTDGVGSALDPTRLYSSS